MDREKKLKLIQDLFREQAADYDMTDEQEIEYMNALYTALQKNQPK